MGSNRPASRAKLIKLLPKLGKLRARFRHFVSNLGHPRLKLRNSLAIARPLPRRFRMCRGNRAGSSRIDGTTQQMGVAGFLTVPGCAPKAPPSQARASPTAAASNALRSNPRTYASLGPPRSSRHRLRPAQQQNTENRRLSPVQIERLA